MSGDFQGSISHTNEFYTIIHGDYRRKAGCDKNETILIGILEVMHDANIRTLLRSEQRGNGKRKGTRYQRIEDIPGDLLWISPSLQELRRRSIEMVSETMLQRAVPCLEQRGFIKTRFIRLDEHGAIVAIYPCTGQCWEEHATVVARKGRDDEEQIIKRLVNCYDFGDEDPRLVVRSCIKQYRLCPDAINRALRGGSDEPPDGDEDPREDDDTPYLDDDLGGDGEQYGETTGNGDSKFTNHHAQSERQPCPPVSKNTNGDSKSTNPPLVKIQTGHGKNTNQDSKSTTIHAHSNKVVITKNLTSNGNKGAASPSLTTHSDSFPALPEHGELTPATIYQIMAHYLGTAKTSEQAAVSIHAKLRATNLFDYPQIFGKHAARNAVIRTVLYMQLADRYWAGNQWLSSAKVDKFFDEMLAKSAAWLPPEEYLTDLDAPEEEPAPRMSVNPTVNQVDADAPPITLPLPTAQETRPASAPVLAPQQPVIEVAPSPEELECRNLGIATRYAPALRRLAAHGYYVGMYPAPEGGYALIDARDQVMPGREHIEPKDLWMLAATLSRKEANPATTLISTVA